MNTDPGNRHFQLPKLSARIWKTPLAVLVTAVIYEYLLGGRNPCFALMGAVYGVGAQFQEGFHNGFNRFIGTFVGGLLVIPFYTLYKTQPLGIPDWIWLVLGLLLVIRCNLALGADSAIQPGTVVYFVVMFTVGEERVVSYTIARIIDTGVGVLIALLLTMLHPSASDVEKGLSVRTLLRETRASFNSYLHNNRQSRRREQELHTKRSGPLPAEDPVSEHK